MNKALLLALVAGLAATAAAFAGTASPSGQRATASPTAADAALLRCGRTRTIGVAAPITGQAASLGGQQLRWAKFYVSRYNRSHRTKKFRIVQGDTQLPDTAQAIQVAERFASNGQILGVVGPAGSQEVQVSTAPLKSGGLGFVSGSATRTSLTTNQEAKGYFFRTVPNDDQQGPRVSNYILRAPPNGINKRRIVVIDGQDAYSLGLSDTVERLLRAARGTNVRRESVNPATTSDFSSLIARIPPNTDVVYIPWQLAPKAQLFGQQLRAAGKNAILFGSDGLFDPDTFRIAGSYVSFFPIDLKARAITKYRRGPGKGKTDLFGLPTHEATKVVARAIDRSCRNGTATRREVRSNIARTSIPKTQSLLGFPIKFVQRLAAPLGPGDMQNPANFGIYRIQANGTYVRVA
jgi:ABC-type branched-subunit amino acid transport system substrate-binding protein